MIQENFKSQINFKYQKIKLIFEIWILGFICIFFLVFCFLIKKASADSSPIVISKVAAFEKSGYEWVEIANRSDQAIDITGWKFWEDETNHKLELIQGSDLVLDPGERAAIVQDKDKFLEEHKDYSGIIIDSAWSSLKETGEEIGLKNANLDFVEIFTYVECPDDVLERIDVNLDDYTGNNWKQKEVEKQEIKENGNQKTEIGGNGDGGSVIGENPSPINDNLSVNCSPAAVLGDDIEINLGEIVFFDASDSFDEDGDALEYSWNFGDGEEGEGIKIEHIYSRTGKFSVILSVYDGKITATDAMWADVKKIEYPKNIFINAVLPNPAGSDLQNEWIKICSFEEENINLDKWELDDEEGGSNAYTIEEVEIKPKECLKFFREETKIALNNNADSVRLSNPNKEIASELNYILTC